MVYLVSPRINWLIAYVLCSQSWRPRVTPSMLASYRYGYLQAPYPSLRMITKMISSISCETPLHNMA
eukprot:10971218-Karenia_brevis.AAC.1